MLSNRFAQHLQIQFLYWNQSYRDLSYFNGMAVTETEGCGATLLYVWPDFRALLHITSNYSIDLYKACKYYVSTFVVMSRICQRGSRSRMQHIKINGYFSLPDIRVAQCQKRRFCGIIYNLLNAEQNSYRFRYGCGKSWRNIVVILGYFRGMNKLAPLSIHCYIYRR